MPELQFPQLPEGGFGASHPNLGDVGNLIVQALGAPQAAVQTILGLGDRSRITNITEPHVPEGGLDATPYNQNATLADFNPLSVLAGLAGQTGGEVQNVGRAALGDITDPLNFMGMGIPGKLRQGMAPGRVASALEVADRFDALPAVLLGKGADFIRGKASAAGTALDQAAPLAHRLANPAKWLQPEISEGKTTRPSNDLLDYFLSTSKQSHLRKAQRMGEGMAESLQAQDYNLYRGVTDEQAYKAAQARAAKAGRTATPDDILTALTDTKPSYDPAEFMTGKGIMQEFNQRYEQKYREAPNALVRIAALEVQRSVDLANKKVWDATYGAFNSGRGAGRTLAGPATGVAAGMDTREMYQQAMRGIQINMKAGEDVLDDAVRLFADVPLTAQQEATLTVLAHRTKSYMSRARTTPSEGVFPIRQVEVPVPGTTPPITKLGRAPEDTMGKGYWTNIEQRVGEESRIMDALQTEVGKILGTDAPRVEPARFASMIGQRREEIGHVLQGQPGALALLPEGPGSEVMTDLWSQMLKGATKSADTKNEMEAAFGRIYEARSGLPYTPLEPGNQTPEKIFAHLNQNVADLASRGAIGPFKIKNQEDFKTFVSRYGGTQELNPLTKRLDEFPGIDLLNTDPIAASQDRAIRMLGPLYGINEAKGPAAKIFEGAKGANRAINSLWKDDVLGTLSYALVNASGALLNHSLSGLPPAEALSRMVRSAALNTVRPNERHFATDTNNLIKATGETPFGAARGYAGNAAAESSGATRAASKVDASYWEKVFPGNFELGPIKGNATVGALGALEGATGGAAVSPADATDDEKNRNIMLGAFLGATAQGIGLPTRAKYARRLAQGVEDGAREAIWTSRFLDTTIANRPAYEQTIRDAFGVKEPYTRTIQPAGARPQQYPVMQRRPSAALLDKTLESIESSDYLLSPQAVDTMLTAAGVSDAGRAAAVKKWRNLNHEANINGQREAGRIQFDYENLNNFEEFMRDAIPFSTYAMKAGPFFARVLLEKPIILKTLADMQQDIDEDRRQKGLTGRTAGAAHFGVADAFWSSVLGYNVMAYYNPLKSIFPWSNTARSTEPRQGEMPLESIMRAADFFGIPTPGPIPAAALRLFGQQGDAPPPPLLRSGTPLQGITAAMGVNRGRGIDIGAGLAAGERRIRGDVADPTTSSTMGRLAEIYLATYGKPLEQGGQEAFPFYAAIANQSGPLWDHAAAQIAKEKGTRSVLATTFGPASPQTFVTGEEAQIRQERKNQQVLSPEFSSRIQRAASASPTGQASPADVQIMRDAALYFVNREFGLDELPSKAQALLDSGTNHGVNQVRKDMATLQAKQHPLSASYVATGGGEEAKLQALLALQANQALQFPGGDVLQRVTEARRDTGLTGRLGGDAGHLQGVHLLPTGKTQKAREALQEQHPILKAYEGWRLTHPDGSVDDFLKEYRNGAVR